MEERNRKRLSSLEEFYVHLHKENANLQSIVLEIQCENKLLKRELKNVVERVDKCEEAILTTESDDDLEIFSRENVNPNPRIGERAIESMGSEDDNEILNIGKGQPVPRIGE